MHDRATDRPDGPFDGKSAGHRRQIVADPSFEPALAAARAYCAVIDGRHQMSLEAFLVAVHRSIASLYAAVIALPEIEPTEADYPAGWSHDQWAALYDDLKNQLGALDLFREIYHPYEPESEPPVVGSLADAIAEVYGASVRALRIADQGVLIDAAFELELQFDIVAGHAAVDAMRALQAHRFDSLPETDSAGELAEERPEATAEDAV